MELEILLVLLVLGAVVVLFVTEVFRVDVIAVLVALTLAWLGLITPLEALAGFASTAVIAMLSVMVLGHGLDRTGVTTRISRWILRFGGRGERRLIGVVSLVAGGLSAFMQNVGATALFLPSMMRIAHLTNVPPSRLLMPVGFAAILGGTITMVGASTLIILNDLLTQADLAPFDLFAVAPIGVLLLLSGIAYFWLFGDRVLPESRGQAVTTPQEELIGTWNPPCCISYVRVPVSSPLVGRTREEVHLISAYNLHLVSLAEGGDILYTPWRYTRFVAGQELGLLGSADDVERFVNDYGLRWVRAGQSTANVMSDPNVGFAEVIVRPYSSLVGKTLRDLEFRVKYGVEVLILLSGAEEQRQDLADRPLQAGDTLVVLGRWERIRSLGTNKNFVLVTPPEGVPLRESKGVLAVACFAGAIALTFVGMPIAVSLLSGALAMVLLRVISIDEAYRAIDWRTLVLIAGLIPLGIAMDETGAAAYIADLLVAATAGQHPLVVLTAVAVLATFFSLFMSNIAATVVLVPLALAMGAVVNLDPRGLALLVGLCTSNSFLLPTHQVNALLMGPGGYRNRDYLRAGGAMTLLFIVIAVGLVYLLYF
ncbi:SLC13 family permease [Methanoculleus sp. FWC-SCC1]|uniref:SLC13 family permease n=1 Tax=Methanoculleus frigidifontis TaxID=2584085 RepID=A0ABT8M9K2_9EURY|nr:SLC13 family permease [Methanoculleus sp. FWC-SCC1]MDN7024618.1 SLC13 family permease [Methanoculleus sp. FWC-SCC1]